MSQAHCGHETVNRRLKQWAALSFKFRQHRTKHHLVFHEVVVLTQLAFDTGDRPWQLKDAIYHDPKYRMSPPLGLICHWIRLDEH